MLVYYHSFIQYQNLITECVTSVVEREGMVQGFVHDYIWVLSVITEGISDIRKV